MLAWASAFVAIRAVSADFAPGALALGRLLVGTVVLGLLLSRGRWVRPTGREWALLVGCGIGWFGIYNVALNAAERHLDAGTTAMLVNVGPLLIALFAGLLLREGFPRWLLVGLAVAFAGVLLIGTATRGPGADVVGSCCACWPPSPMPAGSSPRSRCCGTCRPIQVTFLACADRRDLAACPGPGARRRPGHGPGRLHRRAWSTWASCRRPWRSAPGPTR